MINLLSTIKSYNYLSSLDYYTPLTQEEKEFNKIFPSYSIPTIFIRTTIKSIRNLIYWFPIIWRDRSWDESFIYKILLHKFKRMETYFKNPSLPKTQHTIHLAKLLCERIVKEDYEDIIDQPKRDISYLCKIIDKHSKSWWD